MTTKAKQQAKLQLSLWNKGALRWKLDANQKGLYDQFQSTKYMFVLEAGRKIGKSFFDAIIALETGIRNPGCRINWVAATGKQAQDFAVPILAEITQDAPDDLKPVYNVQDGGFWFPKNGPAKGSFIALFGADDEQKLKRNRGPQAHLTIIDEAAFIDKLQAVIDTLAPTMIRTGGKMLISSSSPMSPGHEFCTIADQAALAGGYAHRDIYKCGSLTKEQIESAIEKEASGKGLSVDQFKATSYFKREYMAQRVIDQDLAIVPTFQELMPDVVKEHPRPKGFDVLHRFVSIDPGLSDFSGGLFGYIDYLAGGVLVIEDEFLLKGVSSTAPIASQVKQMEATLWPDVDQKLVHRVVDDDGERMIPDFNSEHKLFFSRAYKPDREQQINAMNLAFNSKRILINPKCQQLIHQLRVAVRTKIGGDMVRTAKDGHMDLVSALRYMIQNSNSYKNINPYPADFTFDRNSQHKPPRLRKEHNDLNNQFKKLFPKFRED